jgi:hypothetical protein
LVNLYKNRLAEIKLPERLEVTLRESVVIYCARKLKLVQMEENQDVSKGWSV